MKWIKTDDANGVIEFRPLTFSGYILTLCSFSYGCRERAGIYVASAYLAACCCCFGHCPLPRLYPLRELRFGLLNNLSNNHVIRM